jgi:hypothetical protein
MTCRPSTSARYITISLIVFALVAVPTAIYTAGYVWLGEFRQAPVVFGAAIERAYPQAWMANAFEPAARFEGWLRGVDTHTTWGVEGPRHSREKSHRL